MKSKFRDWQESRKEISYKEFAEKYPQTAAAISSGAYGDVENIFIYRDDAWMVKLTSYSSSRFLARIKYELYSSEDMEMVEMRQYLYLYDMDE